MPGSIGMQGILVLGLVLLFVFGAKRIPEMGRSMGQGMREFKESVATTTEIDASERAPEASTRNPVPEPAARERAR